MRVPGESDISIRLCGVGLFWSVLTPPGHEHGKTDGLEDTCEGADGDGVEGTLLGENLGDELRRKSVLPLNCICKSVKSHRWRGAGEEDQRAEVRSTLVAKRASGIDEGTNTVRLDGRPDEGGTPCGGGGGGLLGLEELFLGVGGLCLAVCLAEHRAEDGEGGGVVEDGAERDGRRLDGREV